MAFVQTQEQDVAVSTESPSSMSDIDSLLSEILNDPNVFSLLESPSPAPSPQPPLCLSPSAQQLEQEALASIGQLPQQNQYPAESHRPHYPATETPSPTTPSPTIDNQTFFPATHTHRPPTSLPICPPPPHTTPVQSPLINCEIALSPNIPDTYLRGQRGYLISLTQTIAKVFLYHLGQECQLPCDYVELVVPAVGDYVRVVEGLVKGAVGRLFSSDGTNLCVQLYNGQYMRVEMRNIAKVALRGPSDATCPTPLTPLASPTSPILSPVPSSPRHPSPAPFPSPQYSSQSAHSPYVSNTGYPSNHCLRLPRGGRMPPCFPHSNGARDHRQVCNRTAGEMTQRQMAAYLQRTQGGRSHMRSNHSMKYRFQHLLVASMKTLGNKQQPLPGDVDQPTEEILEEVRLREAPEYDFSSSGDGGEVSSSCIQVSLTCPLSHKRMAFPCRGIHCKHPQCFDGEAYIEFNKCALKPKEKGRNGCHSYQSAKHQVLKCPLCAKHTPFSQLYIDKVTLEIIQDTEEDEVEFDKTGSWKPVEKKSAQEEVIDLTLDDDT